MIRKCRIFDLTKLSPADYPQTWRYQKCLVDNLHLSKSTANVAPDSLMLVEYAGVYTLGKAGTTNNLKFKPSEFDGKVYRVSRGGEVTWHGPGQLVAYPIIDLNRHKKDLRWYIRTLEEVIIRTLRVYGIEGIRSDINPGVWVDTRKICAVGVSASRWITMHGLALNITSDLSPYSDIIPCGISPEMGGVCSMLSEQPRLLAQQSPVSIDVAASQRNKLFNDVKSTFVEMFLEEFALDRIDVRGEADLQILLSSANEDIRNEELEQIIE
jgi:lipoyl(octanoyl) transferase